MSNPVVVRKIKNRQHIRVSQAFVDLDPSSTPIFERKIEVPFQCHELIVRNTSHQDTIYVERELKGDGTYQLTRVANVFGCHLDSVGQLFTFCPNTVSKPETTYSFDGAGKSFSGAYTFRVLYPDNSVPDFSATGLQGVLTFHLEFIAYAE